MTFSSQICDNEKTGAFGIENVGGVFIIIGIGIFLAVMLLGGEYHYYKADWSTLIGRGMSRLSLVERFIVLLCQLSYAIKNQLGHPKPPTRDISCLSMCLYGIRSNLCTTHIQRYISQDHR